MKNLGKYDGVYCFECSEKEYQRIFNRGDDNGKHIYIVDGTMIRNNTIIGYYDGIEVKETHKGSPYYEIAVKDNHDVMQFKQEENSKPAEEVKEKQEGGMTVVSYEELVKQDIDFSKYSTVVDKFFALLEI
jgi:hypothetical protein